MRPVSIVTGFLGAGKTTLINTLLANANGRRYAVVVNEFGDVGVDAELLETTDSKDAIYQLENGCLCCELQGDFAKLAKKLAKREDFERLIVEMSGAADPIPVIHPFLNQSGLGKHFQLDAVITVVDVRNWMEIREKDQLADAQVRAGDFLVLGQDDDCCEADMEKLRQKLRELNPFAMQVGSVEVNQTPDLLVDTAAFDLEKHLQADPDFLDEFARRHTKQYESQVLIWEHPLNALKFEAILREISEEFRIYRAKGIVQFKDYAKRAIIHGVNNRFHMVWGAPWEKKEKGLSKLVLIGSDLKNTQLKARFQGVCESDG